MANGHSHSIPYQLSVLNFDMAFGTSAVLPPFDLSLEPITPKTFMKVYQLSAKCQFFSLKKLKKNKIEKVLPQIGIERFKRLYTNA